MMGQAVRHGCQHWSVLLIWQPLLPAVVPPSVIPVGLVTGLMWVYLVNMPKRRSRLGCR
jgi:hypothetical protein